MVCLKCGAVIANGSKFCSECGCATDVVNESGAVAVQEQLSGNIEYSSQRKMFIIGIVMCICSVILFVFGYRSMTDIDKFIKFFFIWIVNLVNRTCILKFSVKFFGSRTICNALRADTVNRIYRINRTAVFDKCWFSTAFAALCSFQFFKGPCCKGVWMVAEYRDFFEAFILQTVL